MSDRMKEDLESITLMVNGKPVSVPPDSMVSTAVVLAGEWAFTASVTGEPRGPLCGMGICNECRVRIDGEAHQRSCMIPSRPGMEVRTDGHA